MDKRKVATCLRQHLEHRLSSALGCEPHDFKSVKLGWLIHLAFLVHGDQESISGFTTSIRTVVDLLGPDIVWEIEPKPMPEPPEKIVVN